MNTVKKHHMTHIATPVFADAVESLRAMVTDSVDAGATLIELRLDRMWEIDDEDLRLAIANFPEHVRFVLTCRSSKEGGAGTLGDNERLERLAELADAVDFLDVELATWRNASARAVIEPALDQVSRNRMVQPSDKTPWGPQSGLILSMHDFDGRPKTLLADVLACSEESACTVIKVVWQPKSIRACFEAFELLRTAAKPMIALCLGELGHLSRLWAPRFGAFASFFAVDEQRTSAPGQLMISAGRSRYRWDSIAESTALFGVIGHPIEHSLSPPLHNKVFAAEGLDAAYAPFDVAPSYEAFKALMVDVDARPWLAIRGFSVTAPHKEHALRYLRDSGGEIDAVADRIGAINTLTFSPATGWRGTNTDAPGAWAALEKACSENERSAQDLRRALVLGAGGVARAVVAALVEKGLDVVVANRDGVRAEALVRSFRGRAVPWPDRGRCEFDLLVNCTPVGQQPDIHACPWPDDAPLNGDAVIFDTVYRPEQTELLRRAAKAGAVCASGWSMFVAQAELQFREWWGQSPVDGTYADAVAAVLSANA